jgi:hypothetical protein
MHIRRAININAFSRAELPVTSYKAISERNPNLAMLSEHHDILSVIKTFRSCFQQLSHEVLIVVSII